MQKTMRIRRWSRLVLASICLFASHNDLSSQGLMVDQSSLAPPTAGVNLFRENGPLGQEFVPTRAKFW